MSPSIRERGHPDSEVPELFSSPYWYDGYFQLPSGTHHLEIPPQKGFVLVGVPQISLSAELNLRVYSAMGTAVRSHWIPMTGVVIDLEPAADYAIGSGFAPEADITLDAPGLAGPGADAAREVRQLSGLSIDQIAALFPERNAIGVGRMSRENYHRWLSGRTAPGDANLERLLGLRNLLREVAARVDDVRSWLLTPTAALDFEAPNAALRRGALSRLWSTVAQLPVRHQHPVVAAPDGDRGVRIVESLRGSDAGTPADEADDAAGWFDS